MPVFTRIWIEMSIAMTIPTRAGFEPLHRSGTVHVIGQRNSKPQAALQLLLKQPSIPVEQHQSKNLQWSCLLLTSYPFSTTCPRYLRVLLFFILMICPTSIRMCPKAARLEVVVFPRSAFEHCKCKAPTLECQATPLDAQSFR